MALTIATSWTCVVIVCLSVGWTQGDSLSHDTWPDKARGLLSAAEFHFENYRNKIQELQSILKDLPIDQIKKLVNKRSRISKRSEVGQLFNSFLAFCEKLKNEPKSEPSMHFPQSGGKQTPDRKVPSKPIWPFPKTSSEKDKKKTPEENVTYRPVWTLPETSSINPGKSPPDVDIEAESGIWRAPEVRFRPLTLRARQLRQRLVLELGVSHSVPLVAFTLLSDEFRVQPAMKYLRHHTFKTENTISYVKFKIDLECTPKARYRRNTLQMVVSETKDSGSKFMINIAPCNAIQFDNKWKEYKINFNNFYWTLSNTTLSAESGVNKSFAVKLVDDKDINFSVITRELNRAKDKLEMSRQFVRRGSRYGCELENLNVSRWQKLNNYVNSSLVQLDVCPRQSENFTSTDSNKKSPSLIIKFNVNSSSDSNSGVIDLGQQFAPKMEDKSIITSTFYYHRVTVKDKQNQNPIPRDKVAFYGQNQFVCDTNPATSTSNKCAVNCHVYAKDLYKLDIFRIKHTLFNYDIMKTNAQSQVLHAIGTGNALVHFSSVDKENEGKYTCRATLKNGQIHDREVELMIGGLPDIGPGDFNMSVSQGIATITCKATGSNLTVTVNGETPWSYADFVPDRGMVTLERPSANDVIYTAKVSVGELDRVYRLRCEASNQFAKNTEYITVRHPLQPEISSPAT